MLWTQTVQLILYFSSLVEDNWSKILSLLEWVQQSPVGVCMCYVPALLPGSDSLVTPLSPCVSLCQERNIYFPHLSLSRFSSPLITVSLPAVLFSLFALLCRIFPLLSFSTFADTWALGSNQHLSGLQPRTDCTSNLQSPSMFIFCTDCTST